MKLHSSHVAIGCLRVRTPPGGGQAAVAEIERAGWPQTSHDEWLFIRRVEVRATCPGLGVRAAASARRLAASAVDGGSAAASRAAAVRFRSLPELLAWLSADLAAGRAASRWYWRRWARLFGLPPGDALQRLWEEHIAHLPAVTAQLAIQRSLPPVWHRLTPDHARRLAQALAGHTGLPLLQPGRPGELDDDGTVPRLPGGLILRWAGVARGLAPTDARRLLAAALVALEWRPLLLQREPAAALLSVSRGLEPLSGNRPPAPPAAGEEAHAGEVEPGSLAPAEAGEAGAPWQPAAGGPVSGIRQKAPVDETVAASRGAEIVERPLPRRPRELEPPPAAAPVGLAKETAALVAPAPTAAGEQDAERPRERLVRHRTPDASAAGSPRRRAAGATPPAPAPARPTRRELRAADEVSGQPDAPPAADRALRPASSASPEAAGLPAAEEELCSPQGGLFYLINALDRAEILRIIEAQGGWELLPDGWAWLYLLGAELGLEPSGDLARFLARRMGFDRVDALLGLPPLPARDPLMAQMEQLYGTAALWNPSLLRVPARIRCSPSHLDLYYPLSSVRLEVRLAGLDIDPGWVPWLGRVVTFHYQAPPEGTGREAA